MNGIEEILRKYPAIIEHLAKINATVEQLRGNYYKSFWAKVQEQLLATNIQIRDEGCAEGCRWWEVKVRREDSALVRARLSIMIRLYQNTLLIAINPAQFKGREPEFEVRMKKEGQEVEEGLGGYWKVAVDLPNPFTNEALSELIAKDDLFDKKAREVAEKVRTYVEAAERVWANEARD
jgi:hypothetical protein